MLLIEQYQLGYYHTNIKSTLAEPNMFQGHLLLSIVQNPSLRNRISSNIEC